MLHPSNVRCPIRSIPSTLRNAYEPSISVPFVVTLLTLVSIKPLLMVKNLAAAFLVVSILLVKPSFDEFNARALALDYPSLYCAAL